VADMHRGIERLSAFADPTPVLQVSVRDENLPGSALSDQDPFASHAALQASPGAALQGLLCPVMDALGRNRARYWRRLFPR
jgi:hypothetical protein